MEFGRTTLCGALVNYSILKTDAGDWMQFWYSIVPETVEPIAEQIQTIEKAEIDLFRMLKINSDTIVTRRFFSSDLISHHEEIQKFKERQPSDFYLSMTEQPPVNTVKTVLLGMCLSNITDKSRDGRVFSFHTTSKIRHIFVEHLLDECADEHDDSEKQTWKILSQLQEKLKTFHATIEDNVIRTWIYAPHVDADYPGIVKARKELFDSINLTRETHYIASTGIQGGSGNQFARVFMDAYAVTGLESEKIRYIQAPDHLSPTHYYGVTFERATAIEMGNTDFLFISGTASIDDKGDVVHPGNIIKQTERTLENIAALLQAGKFNKEDLSSLIVYLRDPADYNFVKPVVDSFLVNVPVIYVKAFVCRPGWLIEIEATAAKVNASTNGVQK